MNPKSKSKRPKNLKSYRENSLQRRIGSKRQQKGRSKAQTNNAQVEVDKQSSSDILDIIDRSHEAEPEDQGALVDLDDDQVSVTSSVQSGPSYPHKPSSKKTLTLCPVCCKLYQRAKKMKAPLKDKLLDTNPKSVTCDQWILLKPWHSKTMTDSRGKLLSLSQLRHKLRGVKKSMGEMEHVEKEICSRPHPFLQRNLWRCIRKPMKKEKKKNWRKRAREDGQGPRAAKQLRLLANQHQQIGNDFSHDNSIEPVRNGFALNSHGSLSSTSSLESGEDSDLTLRLPSVSFTSETEICRKQNVPKRGAGFKDLLAQLRGNNSMIIRESTTEVSPKKHMSFTGWKRS